MHFFVAVVLSKRECFRYDYCEIGCLLFGQYDTSPIRGHTLERVRSTMYFCSSRPDGRLLCSTVAAVVYALSSGVITDKYRCLPTRYGCRSCLVPTALRIAMHAVRAAQTDMLLLVVCVVITECACVCGR